MTEAVQGTNDDAQVSKLSCVQRGYFQDRFLQYFVRKATRRAPLINRGYFTRFSALQQLIQRFLTVPGQLQIISLGAGYDTTWFRLMEQGSAPAHCFEVDFPEVTQRKAAIIGAQPELKRVLESSGSISGHSGKGHLHTARYSLLPGDLRDVQQVQAALLEAGLQPGQPTLVLAECVLVYMQPAESAALVRQLGSLLTTAACLVYEQIRPDDAFGKQMLLNLERRGCPLLGLHATPSLQAHEQRLTANGWSRATATDLDTVYRHHIDPAEKRRIERLEIFDEFEEWHLIQEHYCITIGINDATGILADYGFAQFSTSQVNPPIM
ncbi:hypothetical protein WJX73_008299 [Symbiochloris irregularis]|uniref:Leucine carboxyl methyltransferase 1 homolog n=1 Tax=Symbiochloris irregularis TaxID=706552 RepID=A0AAW1Q4J8_9CHLO